jgi:quinol monooxygenase YgiN
MPITALLDLHVRPDAVAEAPAIIHQVLEATRGFEGNLGVDVLLDTEDETRFLLVEKWASLEADEAYRAWRATPEGASDLGSIVVERSLTKFTTAEGV